MNKVTRALLQSSILIAVLFDAKSQDLVSGGANSWIFHTPDDGRTTLYIAPGINSGSWNWNNGIEFLNSGNTVFRGGVEIHAGGTSYFKTGYGMAGIMMSETTGHAQVRFRSSFAGGFSNNSENDFVFEIGQGQGHGSNIGQGTEVFRIGLMQTVIPTGSVGIGTPSPYSKLHVSSGFVDKNSLSAFEANLLVEGSGSSRTPGLGAALGFSVPANTDGGNMWQQGRILVTPDNTNNGNAGGRMYLQARGINSEGSAWEWKDNLILASNGNVGIGTNTPQTKMDILGSGTSVALKIRHQNEAQPLWGVYVGQKDDLTGFVASQGQDLKLEAGWDKRVIIGTPEFDTYGGKVIIPGGNVGIGTTTPSEKLSVNGTIRSKEIKVEASPWPDYVFEDDYSLTPLSELETYVKENHHLPEVPSEQEVLENGVEVSATLNLLLKKIEELTLYTIKQQKEIDTLMNSNSELREKMDSLTGKVNSKK